MFRHHSVACRSSHPPHTPNLPPTPVTVRIPQNCAYSPSQRPQRWIASSFLRQLIPTCWWFGGRNRWMHLAPIGWALYVKTRSLTIFHRAPWRPPSKLSRNARRASSAYMIPQPFYPLISFQASSIRPLQERQGELEETEGY